jgi:hypothetical protein
VRRLALAAAIGYMLRGSLSQFQQPHMGNSQPH